MSRHIPRQQCLPNRTDAITAASWSSSSSSSLMSSALPLFSSPLSTPRGPLASSLLLLLMTNRGHRIWWEALGYLHYIQKPCVPDKQSGCWTIGVLKTQSNPGSAFFSMSRHIPRQHYLPNRTDAITAASWSSTSSSSLKSSALPLFASPLSTPRGPLASFFSFYSWPIGDIESGGRPWGTYITYRNHAYLTNKAGAMPSVC